jgi:hypothetical protein
VIRHAGLPDLPPSLRSAFRPSHLLWRTPNSGDRRPHLHILPAPTPGLHYPQGAHGDTALTTTLGPTNIIVDGDRIVIIDWEMAGDAPLEWVRTKFAVSGVLNVERVTRPSGVRDGEPLPRHLTYHLFTFSPPETRQIRTPEWKHRDSSLCTVLILSFKL